MPLLKMFFAGPQASSLEKTDRLEDENVALILKM